MWFSPNLLCNMYVTLCMPSFPVWVFGVCFCGSYCPNVIVFLVCGGTWRCEHTLFCMTLFCVEIVKHHLWIFIHLFIHWRVHTRSCTHTTTINFVDNFPLAMKGFDKKSSSDRIFFLCVRSNKICSVCCRTIMGQWKEATVSIVTASCFLK